MPKVRKAELSFLYMTCLLFMFYISTKYHQNIPKGIRVTEQTLNLFQTKQREITPKVRKPKLSFLYVTLRLVLFYISTKYHQNIPKDIQVQSGQEVLRRCRSQRDPPKNVPYHPYHSVVGVEGHNSILS